MPKNWGFCLFDELFANWFGEATYSNSMTSIYITSITSNLVLRSKFQAQMEQRIHWLSENKNIFFKKKKKNRELDQRSHSFDIRVVRR